MSVFELRNLRFKIPTKTLPAAPRRRPMLATYMSPEQLEASRASFTRQLDRVGASSDIDVLIDAL